MMRSIIVYYSYSGNSKKQAIQLQEKSTDTDIYEVKDKKRFGMLRTFFVNCPKAAARKEAAIQEITVDWNKYERILIFAPIWNAYPAPQFNAIVKQLPKDKEVELFLCSSGGDSLKSKQGTCELIEKAGCRVFDYHDVKTGKK